MNVTVSQLNAYVKQSFSMDAVLNDIVVEGEISGLKMHSSGHIYFSLKDESAAIRCAFFKPHSLKINFRPEDGMKVLARGRVTLYERDGQYQLNVFALEPDGLGELYKQFAQLKKRLEEEGLFDSRNKKNLPAFAKKIGVVTSPTGAVIRDIINVATRRCPEISIVLAPVTVQGEDAPRSICAGLRALDSMAEVDVILLARGGGSMEDLWCFNSEEVARAIFACKKPVISAVGHETDFTIADFVADMRAPTPSAAAELAVFDYYGTLEDIERFGQYIIRNIEGRTSEMRAALYKAAEHFEDPQLLIANFAQRLERLRQELFMKNELQQHRREEQLSILAGRLHALSPLAVLERGYSVTFDQSGKTVKNSGNIHQGDSIFIKLSKGALKAEVTEVEK